MKYDYEEQFTDALKSITDNNLKKKLVAIKKLVCERMSLEKDFKKEHNKLDYKYEQLYKPFYERRQKIIEGEEKPDFEKIREKLAELKINEEEAKKEKEDEKGIPEFWYKVLLNNQDIMLNERDKDVLKKLKLIKCTPEENGNFSLEFFFEPNDYFTNEVLKREFILDEDCDIKEIKSDEIQWKSDAMNTTIEIKQKKVKNKRTKQVKTITKKEKIPSFFSSFKHFEKKEGENKEKEENERPQSPVFQRRIRKTKTQKFTSSNINLFNFGGRRGSIGRIKPLEPNDLKAIQEYSPKKENKISKNLMRVDSPNRRKIGKRSTLKMEGQMINKLVFNQRKKKQNSNLYFFELERKAKLKMDKQNELTDLEKIDTDFLIRTPNDNEFSLELSDKRTMNGNRTYFYEYLNKLNLETKNEKINTYKREVATQLLKFNDFYFDSKLEDFGHDKLFSEIKGNCDLFINKFKMDKYEEKKISDLEKFL